MDDCNNVCTVRMNNLHGNVSVLILNKNYFILKNMMICKKLKQNVLILHFVFSFCPLKKLILQCNASDFASVF